jgi:hypothetical protein
MRNVLFAVGNTGPFGSQKIFQKKRFALAERNKPAAAAAATKETASLFDPARPCFSVIQLLHAMDQQANLIGSTMLVLSDMRHECEQ